VDSFVPEPRIKKIVPPYNITVVILVNKLISSAMRNKHSSNIIF
jgi:hypothetical protein